MSTLMLKCCNLTAYAVCILFNAQAGKKIGDLSRAYDTVATPKSAAFGIWGIIYAWELVFVVAQFFTPDFDNVLPDATKWFCLAQVLQGSWVLLYINASPDKVGEGGDLFFWTSVIWITAAAGVFLLVVQALADLADTSGTAYWLAFGVQINSAWVLLAAGINVSQAARAIGVEGAPLSAIALVVLGVTVFLLLRITGLVGESSFGQPVAFFPVGTWALTFVFLALQGSADENEHVKRILPLYGSTFITLYKWIALALALGFVGLEIKLCQQVQKV